MDGQLVAAIANAADGLKTTEAIVIDFVAAEFDVDLITGAIHCLGVALQSDPRWVGYWAEFRIARFKDLPKTEGDMQPFTMPD